MEITQLLKQFFVTPAIEVPILTFLLNLILTGFLGLILNWIYRYYGTSLSNRKLLGQNLVIMAMTTMLIISIVKSSLALSLGLVGALSIVRFRTAIKEPEELTYLFLAIAIGLGLGANQRTIILIAFLIIITAIILIKKFSIKSDENDNLFLTINSFDSNAVGIDEIVSVLKKNCSQVKLRRLDENKEQFEASFLVVFDNFDQLNTTKSKLFELDKKLNITFLDNKGVY